MGIGGPVRWVSARRWAGIGIRRRPGQYRVWWAQARPDRANRSRELRSWQAQTGPAGPKMAAARMRRQSLAKCNCKPLFRKSTELHSIRTPPHLAGHWCGAGLKSSTAPAGFVLSVLGGQHRCRTVPGDICNHTQTNKYKKFNQKTCHCFGRRQQEGRTAQHYNSFQKVKKWNFKMTVHGTMVHSEVCNSWCYC